jgi:hypothetical protein
MGEGVPAMWMSNLLIVVDRNNVDHNELNELAAAIADAGAEVCEIDEEHLTIEASAPAQVVPTISAMEGVTYVRVVFSYFCALAAAA